MQAWPCIPKPSRPGVDFSYADELAAFAISAAFAQHAGFEVASVKQAVNVPFGGCIPISGPLAERLGFEGGPGSNTPGRIHYSGVIMKMLLAR
ncbi:MAG TPA: hypothetical protein VI488_02415 [Candidatus Angelobacter sp.]